MTEEERKHGGARSGAGRHPSDGAMKHVVKVQMPDDLYAEVTQAAERWKVEKPEAVRRMLRSHLETSGKG